MTDLKREEAGDTALRRSDHQKHISQSILAQCKRQNKMTAIKLAQCKGPDKMTATDNVSKKR